MNQVATVDETKLSTVIDTIRSDKVQGDISANLAGSGIEPDKFTATTIEALRHKPDLLFAERNSLYNSITRAARDGLMPDGVDGVINVYNVNVAKRGQPDKWIKKAQWQRMVGGIIKLFAKAGVGAYAVSVHEGELVEAWNDGQGQHVRHVPNLFGQKMPRVGALAVAALPNGSCRFEAMNMDELGRAREASKAKDTGPWKSWPERMEQKSVLHRLAKRVALLDPVASEALKRLNDEFEDDEEEAPSNISVAANRPKAIQAALARAPRPSQPLPGVKVAPQPEPAPVGGDPPPELEHGSDLEDDGRGII